MIFQLPMNLKGDDKGILRKISFEVDVFAVSGGRLKEPDQLPC